MPRSRQGSSPISPRNGGGRALGPSECALYTYDMLISLKKIAANHRQTELERLIEAAADEAKALARRQAV